MKAKDYLLVVLLAIRLSFWECCSILLLAYTARRLLGWLGLVLVIPISTPLIHAMAKGIVPYVRTKRFYFRARAYAWFLLSLALFLSSLSGVFAFLALVPSVLFWDRMFAGRIVEIDYELVEDIMRR
jgi:hypothetical protein